MLELDLHSLRYFIAVAEECHIGRAANCPHMTQPPLSRAIRTGSHAGGRCGGTAPLAVGILADAAEQVGGRLVPLFRARYPRVHVTIHESDLGDPTAGLRAGLVDVAITCTAPSDARAALSA